MTVNINYTVEEIAAITKGSLLQHSPVKGLNHLLLDSRKLAYPDTTIFFAVKVDAVKTKNLVHDLYKSGVKSFLISEAAHKQINIPANFILVKDTLKALQDMAIYHRNKFENKNIPVIGITGSNGKTIIKEWLNQLLESDYNIVRSPKSYNSQIGVPLSVLQMNESHTLAIFEAGISKKGEMEILEKIIKPYLGIFTNIGTAHDEGFQNQEEKMKEKLKLFTNADALIFCADYSSLDREVRISTNFQNTKKKQLFSWGKKKPALVKVLDVKSQPGKSTIKALYQQNEITITIPFTDDASIENAITCWCVLLHLNIHDKIISERMLTLFPIEMRLELKQGINNCAVINDSYSLDINSLSIALDFLTQQQQHPKHTIILSDILQSGKTGKALYSEVASILQHKKIDKLIAIGIGITLHQKEFSFINEKYFFESVDDFKNNFRSLHFNNETILIKGARVFEFEQINQLLEQKVHQTILSINLDAIVHNLKKYQSLLKPSTKIMAMVKAFSYGSGSFEVAALLQFHKVDYLGVAYADEGVELRKAGVTLPIMVMNPDENTFSTLVEFNLEPEIFSFALLYAFEKYLLSSAINYYPVHIKLDTGMHRLGFESKDVELLARHLSNNKRMEIKSVFSHLVSSEDADEDKFTLMQAETFLESCRVIEHSLGYTFLKHIANTSGISRHPGLQFDMVRLGIGLYGIDNNVEMLADLRNVTTLSTTIAQVKNIVKGDSVGYGRTSKVKRNTVIATVRIGYADGYPRQLGNGKGKMLLKNALVPVIGNVCMDMTMLDITGIADVKEGDEVIVFGEALPVQRLAEWSNSIPYEIMTGISQRVKRIYFQE